MPNAKEVLEWYEWKEREKAMNIEKLKKANGVTEDKKPNDKQRIAELEQENAELLMAVVELADIIAGGE
jgi:L-lactate utilization protein LutC